MKILKYVINNDKEPILFSRNIFHNEVCQNSISAGYVILLFNRKLNNFSVNCFGESTTLKLKAAPIEDKKIIDSFLNNSSVMKS